MQGRRIKNGFIYESCWTINECIMGTALAFFLCVFLLIARFSLPMYFICSTVASFFSWQLLLRKSFFYEDYLVVVFPLRLFIRETVILYKDIRRFEFKVLRIDGDYLYVTRDGASFLQRSLSSSRVTLRNKKKRLKLFFFFKHLKSIGYDIHTNELYSNTLEKRIEMVFGSGITDYVRMTPEEKKKSRKKSTWNTVIFYVVYLVIMVLCWLYYSSLN